MKQIAGRAGIDRLQQGALHDLQRRREPTKQVAHRHQVGQQIDFWIRLAHLVWGKFPTCLFIKSLAAASATLFSQSRNDCRSAGYMVSYFDEDFGANR